MHLLRLIAVLLILFLLNAFAVSSSSLYLGFQLSFMDSTDGSCGGEALKSFSEEYTQCSPLKLLDGSQFFFNGIELNSSTTSAYCEQDETVGICETTNTCLKEECKQTRVACFHHVFQGNPSADVLLKCIWQNRTTDNQSTTAPPSSRPSVKVTLNLTSTFRPYTPPTLGLTQIPTPKPTPVYVPAICLNPIIENAGKIQCASRIAICAFFGYPLKFVGDGCNTEALSGGCQCAEFCGYTCAAACNADMKCTWQKDASQCVSRDTSLPSVPKVCEKNATTLLS